MPWGWAGKMFIGVDPGIVKGGWAIIHANGEFMACGHVTQLINCPRLGYCLACVEAQSPRRTDAPGAQYGLSKLLIDYGRIQGIFEAWQTPCSLVYPITWRSHFRLVKAPWRAILAKAVECCPGAPVSLQKDDGMAVAILLAHYARFLYKATNTEGGS